MKTRSKTALVLLALVLAPILFALVRYPGMTLRLGDHLRDATWTETRNLFRCILYWTEYMQLLEADPVTGIYRFPPATGAPKSDRDCILEVHRGHFPQAAACLEGRIASHGESADRLFWLAMAAMREAEASNCLEPQLAAPGLADTGSADTGSADTGQTHTEPTPTGPAGEVSNGTAPLVSVHVPSQTCTLPLLRPHGSTAAARKATAAWQRYLEISGGEDPIGRWLLTFNALTAGIYPEGVPAEQRIDTPFLDAFYGEPARDKARRYAYLQFTDRAQELGVASLDAGRGVAVEDFDGDGRLDLMTAGSFSELRYYHQEADGTFVERSQEAGLGEVWQPFAVSAADYDNDGWMDLFVGRPFDLYRLFRNLGQGHFVDVTEESGLLAPHSKGQLAASWAAAWGDVDLDGDLDLFLAQWGMGLPMVKGLLAKPRMNSTLFINEGGTFQDRTAEFGLEALMKDQYFVGAAFGDTDGDGDPDLFLSSPVRQASVLLRNDLGDGDLQENKSRRFVATDLIDRGESGFYAAFLDVDHDGRLDIFQGGFSDATTSTQMTVFGEGLDRFKAGHSTILHQQPDGTFQRRDDFFDDATMPMGTMGSSYGDLNNDGCFDFYLGTGNPEGWFVLPNLMYIGRREGRSCTGQLENISMLQGFGTIQKGHGIVFFDYDEDGDEDVYSSLGGMWPADAWPNQFFVNESTLQNTWIKIRLRGRQTNHFGVGARIEVEAHAADGSPIHRTAQMDNKTGFGSAPYLAHVGLLDAVEVDRVRVFWPVSGCVGEYAGELLGTVVLDEGECGGLLVRGTDLAKTRRNSEGSNNSH